MKLPLYQVDAFTSRVFSGNPAAVVTLDHWLADDVLQAIAAENNLAETAFVVPDIELSRLRWFTPTVEVDLCGHATLATGHVLFTYHYPSRNTLRFSTRSGVLAVSRHGDRLTLDFPARPGARVEVSQALEAALGEAPREAFLARDLLAVFESEAQILALRPDLGLIAALDAFAVIVSAPGTTVDFVSRFFAPRAGIAEDPVTGSAHCTLVPYWAERLGKSHLTARQLSRRGGELECELREDRVAITGHVVDYLRGEINVPDENPPLEMQTPYSKSQSCSIAELTSQILEMGVISGSVLLVHSSFSRVGPVEDGPLGLIRALHAALGPQGTLVMPSMSDDDDHPFDPRETRCLGMGVIADTFWRMAGVERSDSPHAFAARGPDAARITADHPFDVPHGLNSPVGRVYELGGQILLLGVGHDANTTVHLAESLAGVRYRRQKSLTLIRAGQLIRCAYGEIDHCCERFTLVNQWLEAEAAQRVGRIGHGEARLVSARPLVALVVDRLRADETVFLHEPGIDVECDEARASIG